MSLDEIPAVAFALSNRGDPITMQYRVKVEWNQEDATADLGQIECGRCQSAANVGLELADADACLP